MGADCIAVIPFQPTDHTDGHGFHRTPQMTRRSRERRPSSEPEQPHRGVLPRGLPGSAIVWIVPGCRRVVPAHSVPGTPRCARLPNAQSRPRPEDSGGLPVAAPATNPVSCQPALRSSFHVTLSERVRRPPQHVTLSERVPPSESKGLRKKRGGLMRAARFKTCGDSSTPRPRRSLRSG